MWRSIGQDCCQSGLRFEVVSTAAHHSPAPHGVWGDQYSSGLQENLGSGDLQIILICPDRAVRGVFGNRKIEHLLKLEIGIDTLQRLKYSVLKGTFPHFENSYSPNITRLRSSCEYVRPILEDGHSGNKHKA